MKTILTLLLVVAFGVTGQASTNAMLRGIRIVETQDQLHPPRGKLGERGPYQFRRSTWRMHTSSSFDLAENREVANTVARRHYAWIQTQLTANGIEPSPYNVAIAWNAGVNAVIRGRIPAVSRDYATRVVNLAGTFLAEHQNSAQPAETEAAVTEEKPENPPLNAVGLAFLLAIGTANEEPTSVVMATAAPVPTPEPVAAPVEVAAAEPAATVEPAAPAEETPVSPSTDGAIQVRFHTNPVMLAFSQAKQPESPVKVAEVAAAPVEIAANTSGRNDFSAAFGRM